jgi:hypothetical protein
MKFSFAYAHLGSPLFDERLSMIMRNRPFMFCLNQPHDSPEVNIKKVKPFLEKYMPQPSPAEKEI